MLIIEILIQKKKETLHMIRLLSLSLCQSPGFRLKRSMLLHPLELCPTF